MGKKNKRQLFILVVYVSTIIVTIVGATFAYFSASVTSNENAVSMTAAEFKIQLKDDTSLIKSKLIPSKEIYVDRASYLRLDENGNFIHPYEENGEKVIEKTACIDDNLNEICSIYTFTIVNPMTTNELPALVTLHPTINSFANLYFKVVDDQKNVVMEATHITNKSKYVTGEESAEGESQKPEPVVLDGIDITLPKATKDSQSGEIIPSTATYSIILWIMETGKDQTREDSSQVFAGTIQVETSGANAGGITGVFSAGGEE